LLRLMCASKMLAVAFAALGVCSSSMRVRKSAVETKAAAGETIMPILESDFNPIGEGTINGAHGLLIMTFGDGVGMNVDDLRDISLSRKFPAGYTFTGTIHPQVPVSERERWNWLSEEQMAAQSPHPRENPGHNGFVLATMENINFIICPFLSMMVNEGALPLRQNYTKAELQEATRIAGLDPTTGQSHVDGNFLHDPDQIQDIWNMEGFTNEHVTSTGIHDCATSFQFCEHEHPPDAHCVTDTPRDCRHPNRVKFEEFVTAVDTNNDDFITIAELDAAAALAEEHGIPVSAKHTLELFRPPAGSDGCTAYQGNTLGGPLTGPWTAVMALKFDPSASFTSRQWLLNIGQASSGAEHWLWNNGDSLQFGQWNGGRNRQIRNGAISTSTSLATVYDGSTYSLYIDGVFSSSAPAALSLNIQNTDVAIGLNVGSSSNSDFSGCIGGVDIYRMALQPSQLLNAIERLESDVAAWRAAL